MSKDSKTAMQTGPAPARQALSPAPAPGAAAEGLARVDAHSCFNLVLAVTQACNLRCSYCYAGGGLNRSMPERTARRAIDRAFASLRVGGRLELGFFGGEPLLEPGLIAGLADYAQSRAAAQGKKLSLNLTTNGTRLTGAAWSLVLRPDIRLSLSCDGLPEVHDRHRAFPDGRGSSSLVLAAIRRLLAEGKDFDVVMVVRPDTVELAPAGIVLLRQIGVKQVQPTLDLWTKWTLRDLTRLEAAIARCVRLWREGLPDFGIGWFDEKAARLLGVPVGETARCGFGRTQIAVAPSGRLYPCERLIGADSGGSAMRLPGEVFDGDDFLGCGGAPERCASACASCGIESICSTTCRCANYVRTGDVRKPDLLLCTLDRVCFRETAKALNALRADALLKAS